MYTIQYSYMYKNVNIYSSFRFCAKGGKKAYYQGRRIPIMDRETEEWKAYGSVDANLAEAVVAAVGGLVSKVKVDFQEVTQKVSNSGQ